MIKYQDTNHNWGENKKCLSKIIIYIWLENWVFEFGKFSKKYKENTFCQTKVQSLWRFKPNWKLFKQQRKDKGNNKSPFNSRNSNNKRTGCNVQKPNMCFRWGSEDHFITNCPKPDTSDKKFQGNTENPKNSAYRLMKRYKMLKKRYRSKLINRRWSYNY